MPDGTVLDGEVLAYRGDRPLPFSALQQRIGRQRQVSRKARDIPVVFMTYDILEHDAVDIRHLPLAIVASMLVAAIAGAQRSAGRRPSRGRAPMPCCHSTMTTTRGSAKAAPTLQMSPLLDADELGRRSPACATTRAAAASRD